MNFWVIGIFVSLISGVPPESPEHHQHEIICTNLCWHPLSPRGTGAIQDLYTSGVTSTCYVRSYEFGATSVCHQPSRVTQEAQHGPSEAGLKQ